MDVVEVRSKEVRLPRRAVEALDRQGVVAITHYGRRRYVVLTTERFSLVAPLLELVGRGAGVPAELLLTAEAIAIERALAEDREPSPTEEQLIETALRHSPP